MAFLTQFVKCNNNSHIILMPWPCGIGCLLNTGLYMVISQANPVFPGWVDADGRCHIVVSSGPAKPCSSASHRALAADDIKFQLFVIVITE
jgi:hypothetical protein